MKWIILLISIGILRGIIFPDYGFSPNIFIIPFGMPLLIVLLAVYLSTTKRLSLVSSGLWGLFSIYISTLIGILVYGYTNGWQYVINDAESQTVFMATIGIQTITYLIGLVVFTFILKRYNKSFKPTPKSGAV